MLSIDLVKKDGYFNRFTLNEELGKAVWDFFGSDEFCAEDISRELEVPSAVALDYDLLTSLGRPLAKLRIFYLRQTNPLADIDFECYDRIRSIMEDEGWSVNDSDTVNKIAERLNISVELASEIKTRLDLEMLTYNIQMQVRKFIDEHWQDN